MTPEIIATLITLFVTNILSPIISWRLAKKKFGAEVDNKVIDNMKESLEFYKRLSDDNKERLDKVLEENAELREHNLRLEQELSDLRKQVANLSMIIAGYGLAEKSNLYQIVRENGEQEEFHKEEDKA